LVAPLKFTLRQAQGTCYEFEQMWCYQRLEW